MRTCLQTALDAYIREDLFLCIRLKDSQKLHGHLCAYDDVCLKLISQSGQEVLAMLGAVAAISPENERT